jgi:hypothetical protein
MDRLWTEHRWDQLKSRSAKPAFVRISALKNIEWPRPAGCRPFECDHTSTTVTDEPGVLHGTHSGFCALNLAYQMRPERLILVGLDMSQGPNGEAHWWPDYPWAKPGGATTSGKFKAWAAQFDTRPPSSRPPASLSRSGAPPPSPPSGRSRLRDLTLCLPYYINAGMLAAQYAALAALPAETCKACLRLIVVDDASPSSPAAGSGGRHRRAGGDLPHHRRRRLEPGRRPQPGRRQGPHRLGDPDRHRPRAGRVDLRPLSSSASCAPDTVYKFGQSASTRRA